MTQQDTQPPAETLTYDSMRSGGRCDWCNLREAVSEATRGVREVEDHTDACTYTGHQMVPSINYNSLDRIVTAFVDAALTRRAGGDAEEIERLRGLLVDPGSPPWEDARAVLVAELRKEGLDTHADNVAAAHGIQIPSHIALNLIAHARRAGGDAIPVGMKPWHGGEAAPADWDGGDVLLSNGEMGDGNVWDHHPSRDTRIIAYTPKPPAGGDAGAVERDRLVQWVNEAAERATKHGNTEGVWLFADQWRAILAALALPAPVVEGERSLRTALDRAASRLVQCAHHANVCGDTVHQVWDQWAKDARAALSEGRSHG